MSTKKEGKRQTTDRKIQIIREGSTHGARAILEKYGIYPASVHAWKEKLAQMGKEGGQNKKRGELHKH